MKCVILLAFLVVVVASAIARPQTKNQEWRLIKTSEVKPAEWLNQHEIAALIEQKVGFMDVTDRRHPEGKRNRDSIKAFPTTLKFEEAVRSAYSKLSVSRIESFITEFSSYHNRHYQSATGVESAEWLMAQVSESILANGYAGKATVVPFSHSWSQDSIVARIEGADPTLKNEVVVLGAHLDSITSGANAAAPGADDNASGSGALLEAFRGLLESGFIPKRSIEFQWYAAEEVGLRGSQDIAESYYDEGINVISMLNFDVVGYYVSGKTAISFLTDYTDSGLNAFLRLVVEGYLSVPWTNSICGYGCSDHASWDQFGVPAASPSEEVLSPYMHTLKDTIETVSFEQVLEFTKLAVGYSIEVAEQQ